MLRMSRPGVVRRLTALSVALAASVAVGASGVVHASGASGPLMTQGAVTQALQLSSAPVQLVAPADRTSWAVRLAGYANSAATAYGELLGAAPPSGTLHWSPDPSAALQTDASVDITRTAEGLELGFNDPFEILAADLGVGFATGYAQWLMAYAMARLYFTAADDPDAWWIDGAALYMTDLLARQQRATTPVLYSLEGAYTRAARDRQPVALVGEARRASGDAARGKSLATFRLLEALYGESAVVNLLLLAANAPAAQGIRETAIGNLPDDLSPSPSVVLDAWLDPYASIDNGLEGVEVVDQRIRGRVSRSGGVPTWTQVEVRVATGERLYADIPAGTETESWEIEIPSPPVEVRLDPDGLLPDVNRSNNRFGFGDASRIRSFFPLDEQIEIGEIHFDGDVKQVGRKRAENYSVTLRNLTDEPVGLGLLVSAQWLSRPASRSQRRVFLTLPPGEQIVARDFIEFPRRGNGAARIEARYWRADDAEMLNERLLRDPADLMNSYLIIREAVEVVGPDGSPLERLAEGQEVESFAELAVVGGGESLQEMAAAASVSGTFGAPETAASAASDDPFGVRIISPAVNATPLDEMVFTIAVDGPPALMLELYVNNQVVGRGEGNSARATFFAGEDQNNYVLHAVAVGVDGEIATDTRVLRRGAIGFGASVDLVTINVTVRRPGEGFVEDLAAGNFEIIEDGVAQELVTFAKGEDTAVSAALLVDTSSSMIGGGIASARAGANLLVDSLLRGNDRAMVLGFNDRVYLYSDFTNDVPVLRESIATMLADGATSLFDAIVESLRKVNRRVGRRALIVLSDGLDVESQFNFPDVLEYTRQSDVVVYTIGLQLMHDGTELGDASDVVRDSVENLRALAEVTGGSAYFPLRLDELESIYAEIAAELESQYSLSYYPTNQAWDGQWRQLEVRLEGTAGRVQARPGYYGVRPDERR